MSDRFEQALVDLRDRISYPETPVFEVPDTIRSGDRRFRTGWLVAAAAVAAVLVLLAFPGPRAAVANFFGIGSVTLTIVDDLPSSAELKPPSGLEVTLEEARLGVDFPVSTLGGDPDAIFLDLSVPGGMVTLGYGSDGNGYKLLITQLQAHTDTSAVQKLLAGSTSVSVVEVAGDDAFWIEGDPHVVILFDRNGDVIEDSARLAGNTLLFVRDDRTIRIEGSLTLAEALEIAERLD